MAKFMTYDSWRLIKEKLMKASDVIDNLTSSDTDKPLSAKQGKVLNEKKIDTMHYDPNGTFTGKYSRKGKPIFRKEIESPYKSDIPHGIKNLDEILQSGGCAFAAGISTTYILPYYATSSYINMTSYNSVNLRIAGSAGWEIYTLVIAIEYTIK